MRSTDGTGRRHPGAGVARGGWILWTLAMLFLVGGGVQVAGQQPEAVGWPKACLESEAEGVADVPTGGDEGRSRSTFFPEGDLFRPLLADMKEPRFYGSVRSVDFEGPALPGGGEETITAGVTAVGETIGIWERRRDRGCRGFQIGAFTGVFSQFNLDVSSADLINVDFTVGPQVTARLGRWSARLRAFHQSSHLGDEFIINNPDVERRNLSFEAVDALVSVTGRLGRFHGRLYGGGSYIVSTQLGLAPGLIQWGLEARGPTRAVGGGTVLEPLFGADFRSFEEHGWRTTASLKGGVDWGSVGGGPGVRLLAVYLNGFIPFGQFFSDTQLSNVGGEFQVRF